MKNRLPGILNLFISVIAIAAVTVISVLCVGAIKKEQSANAMTRAVTWAASASDCFYATHDEETLARLLDGSVSGDEIIAEDGELTLNIVLSADEEMKYAEISVLSGSDIIYSLSCEKAAILEVISR